MTNGEQSSHAAASPTNSEAVCCDAWLADMAALRVARREIRELRKYLADLTSLVARAVEALDGEMRRPSDNERGRRIAKITNALEMQNDMAIRFGLKKQKRRMSASEKLSEGAP